MILLRILFLQIVLTNISCGGLKSKYNRFVNPQTPRLSLMMPYEQILPVTVCGCSIGEFIRTH